MDRFIKNQQNLDATCVLSSDTPYSNHAKACNENSAVFSIEGLLFYSLFFFKYC